MINPRTKKDLKIKLIDSIDELYQCNLITFDQFRLIVAKTEKAINEIE